MDERRERRLKLRIKSLKDISRSYSLPNKTKELENLEERLGELEEDKTIEKINNIEKKIRVKVEEGEK